MDGPSIEAARSGYRRDLLLTAAPPWAVAVEERLLPGGHAVRVYRPDDASPCAVMFAHGGGWVVGDLLSYDSLCRRICQEVCAVVVSVDYRLAPEHPFPAGLDDLREAWVWVLDHAAEWGGDSDRVVACGESAGANLVASLCVALRDAGRPLPERQVLIYPAVDLTLRHPSIEEFADAPFLTLADLRWYIGHYGAPTRDPRASPLLVEEPAGLPPAVIATAGFDPLRDEGDAYVAHLRAAGVPVRHIDAQDLAHGFVNMADLVPEAGRRLSEILAALVEPISAAEG